MRAIAQLAILRYPRHFDWPRRMRGQFHPNIILRLASRSKLLLNVRLAEYRNGDLHRCENRGLPGIFASARKIRTTRLQDGYEKSLARVRATFLRLGSLPGRVVTGLKQSSTISNGVHEGLLERPADVSPLGAECRPISAVGSLAPHVRMDRSVFGTGCGFLRRLPSCATTHLDDFFVEDRSRRTGSTEMSRIAMQPFNPPCRTDDCGLFPAVLRTRMVGL